MPNLILQYTLPAIILLGILIFVHEFGHFIVAKLMGVGVIKFSMGFGPKIIGRKWGETEYLISAFPLGGYVKLVGENPDEEVTEEDKKRSFSHQPIKKRMAIVIAGPLFNIFLATLIFSLVNCFGVPILTSEVGGVIKGYPADLAGIKAGDKIITIDGVKVVFWEELSRAIEKSEGKELNLSLMRGKSYLNIKVKPQATVIKDIFGEEIKTFKMGIESSGAYVTIRYNPFVAGMKGLVQTYQISKLTIIGIVKLIERVIPAKTIGGPILIVQMAGKMAKAGYLIFFHFMAVLSINLGILNLLPIPILDGGHLFFLSVEGIKGKPLSMKKMEIAQQVGLVILILLMTFAFYNDIARFSNDISRFSRYITRIFTN
jgi:regulator of sigma E protease